MLAGVLQLALVAGTAFPTDVSVHVTCPLGVPTRVVLPEPLHQLRATSAARQALGLSIERTRPQGVLRVEPARAATAVIELRGPTLRVRLALDTVAHGAGGDVHLTRAGSLVAPAVGSEAVRPPAPEATPEPRPPLTAAAAADAGSAPPAAIPSAAAPAPPTPAVEFDLSNLMRATPLPIGRREGLPGQKPMVLVDALRGDTHLWLRFTLEDGAAARVRSVAWEAGPIETYTQEPVGGDLRVVVQLPRASVTRKTRVVLVMDTGAEYRFALSSGTLTDLWRKLFN